MPVHKRESSLIITSVQRLQKELDFEVENSKRLAGQSKQPNSVSTLNNIATKSSNDVVQYKEMLNLAADLTGLLVSTSRETPEGKTYDCIMSDLHDFGLCMLFLENILESKPF